MGCAWQPDATLTVLLPCKHRALLATRWLPDETLIAIASENNLSETAFVVSYGTCSHRTYRHTILSVATVSGLGTAHHYRTTVDWRTCYCRTYQYTVPYLLLPHFPGTRSSYHIRWFTPTVEVNCCGHATLATGAHVRRASESMAIVM